jgi:hypothetical protein
LKLSQEEKTRSNYITLALMKRSKPSLDVWQAMKEYIQLCKKGDISTAEADVQTEDMKPSAQVQTEDVDDFKSEVVDEMQTDEI